MNTNEIEKITKDLEIIEANMPMAQFRTESCISNFFIKKANDYLDTLGANGKKLAHEVLAQHHLYNYEIEDDDICIHSIPRDNCPLGCGDI